MRVSWHIQRLLPWMTPLMGEWGADWVKIVNPSAGTDPFPGVNKLLRFWHDDVQLSYIREGRAGGVRWVRDFLPRFRQFANWSGIRAFETANEPPCNSPEDLKNLREYSLGAMEEANRQGIKLCLFNLPEGNPAADYGLTGDAARASERWKLEQLAEATRMAAQGGHYIGLHAYWLPPAGIAPLDRWHGLGRVQWNVERWLEMGVNLAQPNVLVNETGIDGNIASLYPRRGWRSLAGGLDAYAKQVCELEQAARQLPWLAGLMLFTVGYEQPWGDYDHNEGDLRAILQKLKEMGMSFSYGPGANIRYWHSSRDGHAIEHIVLHGTEGPGTTALSWWSAVYNPDRSSAHVLVCKNGDVIRVVPEIYAAHHAGYGTIPGVSVNPNLVSLGLELECDAYPNPPSYTEVELRAAADVVDDWMERYGIPASNVWLHREIDPSRRSDPRDFSKEEFLKMVTPTELQGWLDQVPATVKAVAEAGLIPLGMERKRAAGGYWGLGWDAANCHYVAVGVVIRPDGIEIVEKRIISAGIIRQ